MSATSAVQHSFAAGLPEPVRAELGALAARREFRQGTVIFREGSVCDEVYLIDSGLVALDVQVPGRGSVRILTVGPGELLGWSPFLGLGQMTATATTLEPTTAFAVSGSKLRALCEKNHEAGFWIMRKVLSTVSQRLIATRMQLLDLFAEPSRQFS